MAKPHRGKGLRELFAHGRGTCPVCGATGIKVLYEQEAGDQKIKVCKPCKAAIKHGKKSVPKVEVAEVEAAPSAE
jgi:RNA polymerase subunit RPABC4/transcription elongation factor Spt4